MGDDIMAAGTFRKFNPGTFQSDKQLIDQFVVRETELGLLLEILEANMNSQSCQHALIVAPRGHGKTMMLARIAAAIRTTETLSANFIPVRFMEESQEVFNLADFWLETLFYLAREVIQFDEGLSVELKRTHAELASQWTGRDLEDRARAAVLEAVDRVGKRLVVMIENLQALNREVDQDFGWKLRKVLQSDPEITLLATATSRFRELDDAEQPFFELFRTFHLGSLTVADCRSLWLKVSGDKVSEREMRPLQVLTGGDPRLLIIIGEFARHQSLRRLMEELVRLLDDHTEYFRGHLETFAKTERRVYLALIDLWQPSRTAEIASRARLDIRVVSSLLGRLVDRGAVSVDGRGQNRTYTATQRLYSIYYKLRRERDEAAIVRNLIHFMSVFYSEEEFNSWSTALVAEAEMSPEIEEGIEQALRESATTLSMVRRQKSRFEDSGVGHRLKGHSRSKDLTLSEVLAAIEKKDYHGAIRIADHALTSEGTESASVSDYEVSLIFLSKALSHWELGEHRREIETYEDLIKTFIDSADRQILAQVVDALWYKGNRQKEIGEEKSAIDTFSKLTDRYEDSTDPKIQTHVANALFEMGELRVQIEDNDGAFRDFDDLINRFASHELEEIQLVALRATIKKESLLDQMGDYKAADAVNEQMAHLFANSKSRSIQDSVARQMIEKGLRRGRQGDSEGAISVFDEVVQRFSDERAPWLALRVLAALLNKGVEQGKQGEFQAAVRTFTRVINEFEREDFIEDPEGLIRAIVAKGYAYEEMGESVRAMETYDDVVQRFEGSDRQDVQLFVARALVNKGVLLGKIGKVRDAVSVFNELLQKFSSVRFDSLEEEKVRALMNKAYAFEKLRDYDSALKVYNGAIELIDASENFVLENRLVDVMMNKGFIYHHTGEIESAIRMFSGVIRRLECSEDEELQLTVSRALMQIGLMEVGRRNISEAIDIWKKIEDRFSHVNVRELQIEVAQARLNLASAQSYVGLDDQALETCNRLEGALSGEGLLNEEGLRSTSESLWTILWIRTKMCLVRGDTAGAIHAFRSIFSLYQPDNGDQARDILSNVPQMVRGQIAESELANILSSDEQKAESLRPLIVALRRRAGEEVRAPREVLEVAEDVEKMIEDHVRKWASDGRTSGE